MLLGANSTGPTTQSSTQPTAPLATIATPSSPPALLPPLPTITLHFEGASREQMMEEFAKATHLNLEPTPADFWNPSNFATATASLDVKDEPFWVAMLHFQEAMDVGFTTESAPQRVKVTRDRGTWGWTGHPEGICGPFLLSVRQSTRQTAIFFQDPDHPADQVSLSIQAVGSPGVDWSIDEDGLGLRSLRTDAGVELFSPTLPVSTQAYTANGHPQLQFSAPVPAEPKIKWLTMGGVCHFIAARGTETIEIADAEKAASDKIIAGVPIHIEVNRSGQELRLKVTGKVRVDGDPKAFSRFGRRLWAIWGNGIHLFGADGTELHSNSGGSSSGTATVSLTKNFQEATSPVRLSWTVPTAVDEVEAPFNIEEIPIP